MLLHSTLKFFISKIMIYVLVSLTLKYDQKRVHSCFQKELILHSVSHSATTEVTLLTHTWIFSFLPCHLPLILRPFQTFQMLNLRLFSFAGMVASIGISNFRHANMNTPRNLIVVGLSMCLAIGLPAYFNANPVDTGKVYIFACNTPISNCIIPGNFDSTQIWHIVHFIIRLFPDF